MASRDLHALERQQCFLLSFFVITTFWVMHQSIWQRAESMTGLMSLLNTVWLLVIVWVPVATALAGSMRTDRLQAVLYIGPMVVARALAATPVGVNDPSAVAPAAEECHGRE